MFEISLHFFNFLSEFFPRITFVNSIAFANYRVRKIEEKFPLRILNVIILWILLLSDNNKQIRRKYTTTATQSYKGSSQKTSPGK